MLTPFTVEPYIEGYLKRNRKREILISNIEYLLARRLLETRAAEFANNEKFENLETTAFKLSISSTVVGSFYFKASIC